MNPADVLPNPPSFSEEEMRRFRESKDFREPLFEWYKFSGMLAATIAHIQYESEAFKKIPRHHFHVLIGLLNRCARLMLSNVALSHEGKFGETTAIVDRCIFESAAKVIWLSTETSPERFNRYLADSLRTELEFKTQIEANIAERGGETFPVENRMLTSIRNHIEASQLSETQINETRRFPDLASILTSIGFSRLIYTVAQRIGSHHVHGTWSSLLFHYLEEDPSKPNETPRDTHFIPRSHDCETHVNQFMFVPIIVLTALEAYVNYVLDEEAAQAFGQVLGGTKEEIMTLYNEAFDGDLTS